MTDFIEDAADQRSADPRIVRMLGRSDALRRVDVVTMARLARHCQTLELAPGDALFRAGEKPRALFLVAAGLLRMVRRGGTPVTCGWMGAPAHVGEIEILSHLAYGVDAIAATPARVVVIPDEPLRAVFARFPEVARELLACAGSRFDMLDTTVDILSEPLVKSRLAALLLWLESMIGDELPDGSSIVPLRLSRTELANTISTTPETVIKTMTAWKRSRVLDDMRQGFLILRRDQLSRLVSDATPGKLLPAVEEEAPVETPRVREAPIPDVPPASLTRQRYLLRGEAVAELRGERLSLLDREHRLHFDEEGRLHRAWIGRYAYQRGLDGRVRRVHLVRVGRPMPSIRVLSESDSARLVERVRKLAQRFELEVPDQVKPRLDAVLSWTPARCAEERARFNELHGRIPILPPDQNRALVVQATRGCAWGKCAFCALYSGQRYEVLSVQEFRSHVRRALDLVGRALPSRRGVFLGDANALGIGPERFAAMLGVISEEIGDAKRWPVASFVDALTKRMHVDDLRELRQRGLTGVTIGLESGADEVLAWVGKPTTAARCVDTVRDIGRAGIRRGVVVIAGLGGARYAQKHVSETIRAISAMGLGPEDRVYISPLVVHPATRYSAMQREVGKLGSFKLARQVEALEAGLRQAGTTARISAYDTQRFVY
jgi:radical SAM superfamily enzyme YgiQ (UPF0313 family)/CRP-like cAMP-binding protein